MLAQLGSVEVKFEDTELNQPAGGNSGLHTSGRKCSTA